MDNRDLNNVFGTNACDGRVTPYLAVQRALRGEDGVGVDDAEVIEGHLYIILTDGRKIDAGEVGKGGATYIEFQPSHTSIVIDNNTINYWSIDNSPVTREIVINTLEGEYGSAELMLRVNETQPDGLAFDKPIKWLGNKMPLLNADAMCRIKLEWSTDGVVYGSWESYSLSAVAKEGVNMTVMCINAKTEYGDLLNPTEQKWANRKASFGNFITGVEANGSGYKAPKCDIIGLQEVLAADGSSQLNDVRSILSEKGYSLVIAARGNTSALVQDSEACIIAFRSDKYTRVSGGYFWLRGGGWNGDTGDFNQEGFSQWDKTYQNNGTYDIKKRIAVWVILREKKTGKEFFVLNTHYNQYFNKDNVAMSTPYYSSEVVKNRIDNLSGGRPVIFLGDLHCNPDKSAISILKPTYYKLLDTRDEAELVSGMRYTMNSWADEATSPTYALFDYIFATKEFKVQSHITANALMGNGVYISDHNPIIVDLYFE